MHISDRTPGMLLVHPRLHQDNDVNSEEFRNWTKLHYRDLLKLPVNELSGAKVTTCMRFTMHGKKDSGTYSHEMKEGVKPAYVYATLVEDLGVVKSQPYYDVSRKLNLEDTRPLGEGEHPVKHPKKDAMVFDLVDAKFAVYEEIRKGSPSFQNLSEALTSVGEFQSGSPKGFLVAINLNLPYRPGGQFGDNPSKPNIEMQSDYLVSIQNSLRHHFKNKCQFSVDVCSSGYRWKGTEAQPKDHPLIDVEKNMAGWMSMNLVMPEKNGKITAEEVETVVKSWAEEYKEEAEELGITFGWGVWERDLIMRLSLDDDLEV